MRLLAFTLLAAAALAPFLACGGGATTPATTSPGAGNNGSTTAQTPGSGEASSTTTQTLGGSGDVDAGPLVEIAQPVGSVMTDAGVLVIVGDGGSARGRNDLMAAVIAHRPEIRACYDTARKQHPELSGHFNIAFVIDPKGSVSDGQIAPNSDITDTGLLGCIVDIIKKIPFGPNPNGRQTIVTYPFRFTPSGGGN